MKNHVSRDDHQRTLAWLDDSLERARSRSRTKSMELLNLVRTEILLDMELSEGLPALRTRAPANGTFSGANRSV